IKQGGKVVILDRNNFGAAASAGNMGWIGPLLSAPVPAQGVVGDSLESMLKGQSPLYIDPLKAPSFAPWLIEFWKNCTDTKFNSGLKALHQLHSNTFSRFDALKKEGVQFDLYKDGFVFAYRSREALEHQVRELRNRADTLGL